MRRVVEEQDVITAAETADDQATERKLNRSMRRDLVVGSVKAVLDDAPYPDGETIPGLVGLAEAAEILGTRKQYVTKLRDGGVLVPVERFQSGPVFRRTDVEAHALQLQESRRTRADRAAEREAE